MKNLLSIVPSTFSRNSVKLLASNLLITRDLYIVNLKITRQVKASPAIFDLLFVKHKPSLLTPC